MIDKLFFGFLKVVVGIFAIALVFSVCGGVLFGALSIIEHFNISLPGVLAIGIILWGSYHLGDALLGAIKEFFRRRRSHKNFRRG